MATTSSLFMYSLTIQSPTAFTQAILGQFSGTKEQQIITASGSVLTLHRADPQQGRILQVISHDVFGIIRTIAAFRLAGSTKDYIIIGSDSGRIAIVEYIPDQRRFKRVHLETFGKSGIRRVVPGQYLAVDPKGRACFLASVEKNKLVYVLNRNAQAELTISSPLEAHKPSTLVFALAALDVGYDNPIFAALELDYAESDQDPTGTSFEETPKQLVYYELDLGLNHVVRKWAEDVDRTANLLLQVPGGTDGPSGVLVCGEESITYRHNNQDPHRLPIPRRKGATESPDRKRHIIAGVTHKMKGAFFSLVQTEDGDLFKVTLDLLKGDDGKATGEVLEMSIDYFDTVPVASSLLILKSGYLLVASESGEHQLYQFDKLGEETGTETSSKGYSADPSESYEPVFFHPRAAENISLTDSISSMNPLTACKVANLTDDDAPQLYSVCGTGARSSFRSLRNGLEVSELAETEMPGAPLAVWATKANRDAEYDAYVVISFSDATLVLEIKEGIEEAENTGFLTTTPTLAIQLLGEDALVQVFSRGIRLIQPGGHITDWPAPQHRTIVCAATNESQVAIALSSGEILYFEKDEEGALAEFDDRREMSGTVTSLSIGDVPEGAKRSSFLAVGCNDCTVRILSLEPESCLENKSVQALSSAPSALSIMPMTDSSSGGSALYLHIGLNSGVYLRTVLDEVTGELSDTRTRFLGPKEIKLFRVTVQGQPAVLALSSRPWLGYSHPQTKAFMLTPLSYDPLEWGWSFSSEQSPEGMVGVQGQFLRIFSVENLNSNLLQESIALAYTPRNLVRHPEKPYFYVVESDNNILSSASTLRLQNDPSVVNGDAAVLPPETFGYPRGERHWASCIQVVDPITDKQVTFTIDLEENEAAVSVAAVPFASQDGEVFLIVGTGKDMVVMPRSHNGGFIHVYRINDNGRTLEFLHKTKTAEPPLALLAFQGRLLTGIGNILYIHDLGIKQMIRKARNNVVPNLITGLQTQGSRIIVSDHSESVTFVVYKAEQNLLLPFADDTLTRWTTCTTMVDYTSVAGGDKFGNLWLVRCPQSASDEADEPGAAAHLTHERGYLQGTPNRLQLVAHFFPKDTPTSIHKCQLVAGGRDVLLWAGLAGTIGVLVPFVTRDDVDFFQSLEQHLRSEDPPLAGRDHLAYRSYYVPVKGVIDGDLCERYQSLTMDKKISIAGELERSVREVERKVQDMRSRAAY